MQTLKPIDVQAKVEGLQRQQAQIAILEAALGSSRSEKQKSLDKTALLGELQITMSMLHDHMFL